MLIHLTCTRNYPCTCISTLNNKFPTDLIVLKIDLKSFCITKYLKFKFISLENVFLYIFSFRCSRGSFRPLSGYDVKSQSRSRRQLQEAGATSMDLKRASSRRSFEQGLLINSMYNDYGFQGVDAET